MPSFLAQTAREILENHPDLRDISIIMPSRRAAVFLKKELGKQLSKPVWSPDITTIEDFVLENGNLQAADQPTLIFKLYESYTEIAEEPRENFADFSQWAHLLLADFNEIDRYCVDAGQIFSYLADVERIKKWDLRPGQELTEMVKNYLKLWESLPRLYQAFTERLKAEKRVYQGMAYREMAENIETQIALMKQQGKKFIFVGFNALNAAEEIILKSMYREGLSEFYWDVDDYYFKDKDQEAGIFLRQSGLVKELIEKDDFKWRHNALSGGPKNIEIINVSGKHLQAVAANAAVLGFQEEHLENIAVVLADENLLPGFLNTLAEDIGSLNITMGLPLASTPAAGFFQLLLDMFQEFEHTGRKDGRKNPCFHFQKWDDLLGHFLFKRWAGDAEDIEMLRGEIRQKNRIFISANELEEYSRGQLDKELIHFFNDTAAAGLPHLWKNLADLAEAIHKRDNNRNTLLQSLFGFFKLFNRLSVLMAEYPYVTDIKTAVRFYRDFVRSETLDIYGEPLSGVQLMGMLETRTLDFKNLVITSLNEDILPKGRTGNSLIPFDIKREFGLPTYLDKDAVFAYHFYRLLQRAENVVLIYNGFAEGLGSGEPSRFIRQLQLELPQLNKNVLFKERNPAFEIELDSGDDRIEKSPAIISRLEELAKQGFSATAVIDYINDPLTFYKKRILNLQDTDEVEEVAGYDTQGNVVHHILEEFYSVENRPKSVLHAQDPIFSQTGEAIRKQVVEKLKKEAKLSDLDVGKNLLIREILTGMISKFLTQEKRELEQLEQNGEVLWLMGLEAKKSCHISLGSGQKIKLKGIIDRIDRAGNEVRVIDYKTGSVNDKNIRLEAMEDLRKPKEKNKALQLMMYAYLFFNNEDADDVDKDQHDEVWPGIISLRNTGKWLMPLKFGREKSPIGREMMPEFEDFLKSIFEEMFDESIPFSKKPLTLESDD